MSGTLVIWSLLAHNQAVLNIFPIAKIKEGVFPVGTAPPLIEIERIGSNPQLTVAMTEPNRMITERVQVRPLLKGVDGTPVGLGKKGVDSALAIIRAACPHTHGSVAGVNVVSILPDTVGPDDSDVPASLYSATQDFIVKWKT